MFEFVAGIGRFFSFIAFTQLFLFPTKRFRFYMIALFFNIWKVIVLNLERMSLRNGKCLSRCPGSKANDRKSKIKLHGKGVGVAAGDVRDMLSWVKDGCG